MEKQKTLEEIRKMGKAQLGQDPGSFEMSPEAEEKLVRRAMVEEMKKKISEKINSDDEDGKANIKNAIRKMMSDD